MTDKTEAQPEALRLEMHQECAEFATSLRSAANTVQLEGKKVPPSFLRAADLFERSAAELRRKPAEYVDYGPAGHALVVPYFEHQPSPILHFINLDRYRIDTSHKRVDR